MPVRFLFRVLWIFAFLLSPAWSADEPALKTATPPPASVPANYVLSPNDLIVLRVFQEDDLTGQYRISSDGTVTFPLIGSLKIGGKTIDAAARALTVALKRFLINPHVSIAVAEYSKRRFIVLGQVQHPGTYLIPNEERIDLLTAIAAAGGYTRFADPANVIVKRRSEGREVIHKLNAKTMAQRQEPTFEILPDDKITVGERVL